MNYEKILGIFVWGIFLMNMASGATTATTLLTPTNLVVDYDSTYVDANLRPGDSGVLQLVIKNSGGQAAKDARVFIPQRKYIQGGGYWKIGRIEAGSQKTLSRVIRISEDAKVGLYTLRVTLTYDGYEADGDIKNDEESSWEIPIRVYGNPNFQLSPEKVKFSEDVAQELELDGITRSTAKETSVTLSSDCVTIIGSSKEYLGDLSPGEEFSLKYNIKPTQVGICTLSFSLNYVDVSGSSTTETLSVGIEVERADIDLKISEVSPQILGIGTIENLSVKVTNLGTIPAKDASMELELSSPFTALKTSERYLGEIEPQGSKEILFQILVDSEAEGKAYQIPVEIEYYDESGNKGQTEKNLGIRVSGKPEISLNLESSDPLTTGSGGKISLNVINKGFADVKFLSLKLLSTSQYKVVSRDEIYFGNLDSDDSDSEEFEIKINDQVPPGKIFLEAQVKYKEENSDVQEVEIKKVPLMVLTGGEYSQRVPSGPLNMILSTVGFLVGGFILVIVLWLLYKLLRLSVSYLDEKIFRKKKKG